MCKFFKLPPELHLEILSQIEDGKQSLVNLSLVSHKMRNLVLPMLFSEINIVMTFSNGIRESPEEYAYLQPSRVTEILPFLKHGRKVIFDHREQLDDQHVDVIFEWDELLQRLIPELSNLQEFHCGIPVGDKTLQLLYKHCGDTLQHLDLPDLGYHSYMETILKIEFRRRKDPESYKSSYIGYRREPVVTEPRFKDFLYPSIRNFRHLKTLAVERIFGDLTFFEKDLAQVLANSAGTLESLTLECAWTTTNEYHLMRYDPDNNPLRNIVRYYKGLTERPLKLKELILNGSIPLTVVADNTRITIDQKILNLDNCSAHYLEGFLDFSSLEHIRVTCEQEHIDATAYKYFGDPSRFPNLRTFGMSRNSYKFTTFMLEVAENRNSLPDHFLSEFYTANLECGTNKIETQDIFNRLVIPHEKRDVWPKALYVNNARNCMYPECFHYDTTEELLDFWRREGDDEQFMDGYLHNIASHRLFLEKIGDLTAVENLGFGTCSCRTARKLLTDSISKLPKLRQLLLRTTYPILPYTYIDTFLPPPRYVWPPLEPGQEPLPPPTTYPSDSPRYEALEKEYIKRGNKALAEEVFSKAGPKLEYVRIDGGDHGSYLMTGAYKKVRVMERGVETWKVVKVTKKEAARWEYRHMHGSFSEME